MSSRRPPESYWALCVAVVAWFAVTAAIGPFDWTSSQRLTVGIVLTVLLAAIGLGYGLAWWLQLAPASQLVVVALATPDEQSVAVACASLVVLVLLASPSLRSHLRVAGARRRGIDLSASGRVAQQPR